MSERPQRGTRHPALAHLPFLLVLLVVAIGVLRIVQYHWRQGAVLVGVALLLAAVLRAVLRDEQLGLITVRSRPVDVLTYGAFGTTIIAVAVTIEGFLFD